MPKRRRTGSGGGGGTGFSLGGLIPAVVLVVVAAAAYLLISRVSASDITDPLNEYLSGLKKAVTGAVDQGTAALTGAFKSIDVSIPDLSGLLPGTYQVTPGGETYAGTGLGNLFVTAGSSTPVDYYPLGPVVTTSRDLSTQEQLEVIQNLQSSGIKDAWWNAGELIAEQDQINAGQQVNQQGHYVCQNKEGWDYVPC